MSRLKVEMQRGRFVRRVLWVADAHACVSFITWFWTLGIALGLGFRDGSARTAWDKIQSAVVPPIAFTITLPGRLFLSPDLLGMLVPWLANSILWSVAIVLIYSVVKSMGRIRL
jgi:hypothetical protein